MLRYKACRNSIVTLELLDNTKTNENRKDVVDDRYAKFRCDRAIVIDIVNVETGKTMKADVSIYDDSFYYILDGVVKTRFNENNKVCAEGIHYFKTKEAAVSWFYLDTDLSNGKITYWYESGQKKSEGTYKDGIRDGKYISWFSNGEKKSEGTYINGKFHGKRTHYYNGHRIEGTFVNGEMI